MELPYIEYMLYHQVISSSISSVAVAVAVAATAVAVVVVRLEVGSSRGLLQATWHWTSV